MRVEGTTIEDLINNSENVELMQELYDFINAHTDIEPEFSGGETINVIGYKFVPYKTTTYETMLPLVAIGPQKNYVGLYVSIYEDGVSFLEQFRNDVPKSSLGKGCFRIKKMDENTKDIVAEIVAKMNSL